MEVGGVPGKPEGWTEEKVEHKKGREEVAMRQRVLMTRSPRGSPGGHTWSRASQDESQTAGKKGPVAGR